MFSLSWAQGVKFAQLQQSVQFRLFPFSQFPSSIFIPAAKRIKTFGQSPINSHTEFVPGGLVMLEFPMPKWIGFN